MKNDNSKTSESFFLFDPADDVPYFVTWGCIITAALSAPFIIEWVSKFF